MDVQNAFKRRALSLLRNRWVSKGASVTLWSTGVPPGGGGGGHAAQEEDMCGGCERGHARVPAHVLNPLVGVAPSDALDRGGGGADSRPSCLTTVRDTLCVVFTHRSHRRALLRPTQKTSRAVESSSRRCARVPSDEARCVGVSWRSEARCSPKGRNRRGRAAWSSVGGVPSTSLLRGRRKGRWSRQPRGKPRACLQQRNGQHTIQASQARAKSGARPSAIGGVVPGDRRNRAGESDGCERWWDVGAQRGCRMCSV